MKKDTEEERNFYSQNPHKLMDHIRQLEDQMNQSFDQNIVGTPEQKAWAKNVEKRMREMIKDERMLEG